MMPTSQQIRLPLATDATVTGPKFDFDSEKLVVKYDRQFDDGKIEWAQITFKEVLSMKYYCNLAREAQHVNSPRFLIRYATSPWLRRTLRQCKETLGSQWEQDTETTFGHFVIYFDDAGCVEVIARLIEFGEERT